MKRPDLRKRAVLLVLAGYLCSVPAHAASVIEFTRTGLVLNELDASGGSLLSVVVSITPPLTGPAQVTVTLAEGSAQPEDFWLSLWDSRDLRGAGAALARLWFEADTATREFQIVPLDDGLPEAEETLILGLTDLPPGTVLGARSNLVITIQNAAAQVGFSEGGSFVVSEGDEAWLEVHRRGDTNAAVSVQVAAGVRAAATGAATEGEDFLAPDPTVIEFGPGERLRRIRIPTLDDGLLDIAVRKRVWLELSASPGVGLGRAETWFDILDRQYSTALDLDFSPPAGFTGYVQPARAPDGTVLVAAAAADGSGHRLILLNPDGSVHRELPSRFGQLLALACQADGKFLVARQEGIWRHYADGALDGHFVSPTNVNFNGAVTLLPTSSGRVYVRDESSHSLTRLLPDGRQDPEFPDLELPAGPLRFALDREDRLLVLGARDERAGFLAKTNHLLRFLADGKRDAAFAPRFEFSEEGFGWWGSLPGDLVVLPDGKLLVAGRFTAVNGVRRPYLARLHEDGTLDEGFHYQSEMPWIDSILPLPDGTLVAAGFYLGAQRIGSDGAVMHSAPVSFVEGQCVRPWVTILAATNARVLLGGEFYHVNGGMERPHLVQVRMQGAPRTAAVFRPQQMETMERDAPAYVEVLRLGDVNTRARVHYRTRDGTARAGEDYAGRDGTIEFEPFEQSKTIEISMLPDALLEGDETFEVVLIDATGVEELGSPVSVTIVDASTRFAAGGIRVLASGEVELVYTAPSWQVIEASADLWNWTRVQEVREWRDDYRYRVIVPAEPSGPARFFRILSPGRALRAAVRPKC
ncbi:MAG: hypothetical protein HS113_12750 [Verrucomicrobiales bacterium]|nr:hypothetical protein [Verrucomicrobiales bacterium]